MRGGEPGEGEAGDGDLPGHEAAMRQGGAIGPGETGGADQDDVAPQPVGARGGELGADQQPREPGAGPLGGEVHLERGTIEGHVLRERRGEGGFGYDPLFLPIGETRTTAEMPAEEKNAISHRAEASTKMREFLRDYLGRR